MDASIECAAGSSRDGGILDNAPAFGTFGAALVIVLCSWLDVMTCVLVGYRLWSIVPPMGTLWRNVVISVLAYAVAVMWPASGFWLLVKLSGITIVILLTYLILLEFIADEIA